MRGAGERFSAHWWVLFLDDAQDRRPAGGHGPGELGQLGNLIHVGDHDRREGRLGPLLQQRQIDLDDGVAPPHALPFLGDAPETLPFQLDGVDADVDKQLDARLGLDGEGVVGLEDLPTVPSTGATTVLPVGLMATPSPTIFSANTVSGTSSILTISPDRGA